MGFSTNYNRGFQIKFSNGYYVSCQFGNFNYCSRRRSLLPEDFFEEEKMHNVTSPDCELAVVDPSKSGAEAFITGDVLSALGIEDRGDGMVIGYVSPEEAAKIIAYVSGMEV